MADPNDKVPENVPGKYYVDGSCIAARFCLGVAPDNFAMSDSGHAYVCKQPEGAEELEAVKEALDGCPVLAIGDDG